MTASKLEPPHGGCFVCRSAIIPLTLDVNEWTLERLLDKVVKARLGFEAPTVLINGDFVWEEGEGADSEEFKPNLPKVLSKLPCGGIQHGTVFELDDATQDLTIQVSVTHQAEWDEEENTDEYPFVVGGAPPKPKPEPAPAVAADKAPTPAAAKPAAVAENNDDDNIVLVLDDDEEEDAAGAGSNPTAKRSAEDTATAEPPAKKKRVEDEVETIEID